MTLETVMPGPTMSAGIVDLLVVVLLAYFTLHRRQVLVGLGEVSKQAAELKEGTEQKGRPSSTGVEGNAYQPSGRGVG